MFAYGISVMMTAVACSTPSAQTDATRKSARPESHAIIELRARHLTMPVAGARPDQLINSFRDVRGRHPHEALDIPAPRSTPVVAVEDGTIAKLFWSNAGGNTIYQFDPTGRYAYYFAHLDRYADGLAEQQHVQRGQTIGYVGSTGNANPASPHLHFAIFVLTPERQWWKGTAIDSYAILRWADGNGTP
jgi:murein DD-endopeptidase MepM/ murein hydrolase activator NlpD